MKILSKNKVEDCLDGSAIYTYEVSEPWSEENIKMFMGLGALDYHKDFPRPLFRLRASSGLFASGVSGATSCRVIFPTTNREKAQQEFDGLFQ